MSIIQQGIHFDRQDKEWLRRDPFSAIFDAINNTHQKWLEKIIFSRPTELN